ncbi:hypothetical protein [Polyangium sp. 15x6]|uniref:hypothetical protein n=1 Tax=Polyangium sp. 15x6 TaxID=3042687 RepID=UPI00249AE36C|nr:hypothetical protein [Polyangium sp. 15x6]MDI3285224.1 hypothetical protein [Polyangium sp. 15x6]
MRRGYIIGTISVVAIVSAFVMPPSPVLGSGTGVFEGVRGRLDFKDDVDAVPIRFLYRGHLRF